MVECAGGKAEFSGVRNGERREQSASFIFTMVLYPLSQHLCCSEGSCCAKTASSECRGALTAVLCSFQPHDYHCHHLQEKFVTERYPAFLTVRLAKSAHRALSSVLGNALIRSVVDTSGYIIPCSKRCSKDLTYVH